ncbi:hypothetical protein D3C80_1657370 [compost metagenome]
MLLEVRPWSPPGGGLLGGWGREGLIARIEPPQSVSYTLVCLFLSQDLGLIALESEPDQMRFGWRCEIPEMVSFPGDYAMSP